MVSNSLRRRIADSQRKTQLTEVSRGIFAAKGLGAASMEEIATAAGVSRLVVYEHFGTKERLYRVVVDQEMKTLEATVREVLSLGRSRYRIEQAVLALLTYVEESPKGFSTIPRDPGMVGGYETLLNSAAESVTPILAEAFRRAGFDPVTSVLYGNCMVGMVSQTARWWMEKRSPDKKTAVTHIVNLCQNGLVGMEGSPTLRGSADVSAATEGAEFGAGTAADPIQMTENG